MIRDRRRWLRWSVLQVAVAGALAAGLVVATQATAAAAGVAALATLLTGVVATALFLRREPFVVTAADLVTHVRAVLLAVVVGLLAASASLPGLTLALTSPTGPPRSTLALAVAALVVVSVVLDGVDGRVARARGEDSVAGGRFDIAVDCALAAVLAVAVAGRLGPWVLLLGALPYLFGVAGRAQPWLRGPLPPRRSRKVIGVLPPLALALAQVPTVPATAATVVVGVTLALVLGSFGRDVVLLRVARVAGGLSGTP